VPDTVDLTARLVRIASVNPDLVPGAAGEADIAAFCEAWLAGHGLEVHRLESKPGRPSVVGIARGRGGAPSLMLNGHYDTVTLAGYAGDPLAPVTRKGRLHGRGAFDMKSGLAAAMVAAARAATMDLAGDVLVACVADEEYASEGTAEVLRSFSADAGIVAEPSHLEVTLAHKGFAWFDVVIAGRAAHGSRPDLGIDAIAKAGHFLVALEAWGARLAAGPAHPLLGTGTVHASIVRGGEEASSYPAECRVTIERRTIPGETGESVQAEIEAIMEDLAGTVPDFAGTVERGLVRQPFEADPDHPVVTALARHAEAVLGRPAPLRGEPFWTDCALMQEAGIATVMFGVDGAGAHAATEWVDLASVRAVADIFTATIADYCGAARTAGEQAFVQAIGHRIAALWEEVFTLLPRIAAGEDPEAVHDARVATRRLRAAMDAAADLYPEGWYGPLHKEAKAITRALGRVRDYDVLLGHLAGDDHAKGTSERTGQDYLAKRLRRDRRAERAAMRKRLARYDSRRFRKDVRRHFGDGTRPVAPGEDQALRDGGRAFLRQRAAALLAFDAVLSGEEGPPEPSHEARIAAKRLRYALELFAPEDEATLSALKQAQEHLGDLHDTDVRIARLREEIAGQDSRKKPDPDLRASLEAVLALDVAARTATWAEVRAAWRLAMRGRSGKGIKALASDAPS